MSRAATLRWRSVAVAVISVSPTATRDSSACDAPLSTPHQLLFKTRNARRRVTPRFRPPSFRPHRAAAQRERESDLTDSKGSRYCDYSYYYSSREREREREKKKTPAARATGLGFTRPETSRSTEPIGRVRSGGGGASPPSSLAYSSVSGAKSSSCSQSSLGVRSPTSLTPSLHHRVLVTCESILFISVRSSVQFNLKAGTEKVRIMVIISHTYLGGGAPPESSRISESQKGIPSFDSPMGPTASLRNFKFRGQC